MGNKSYTVFAATGKRDERGDRVLEHINLSGHSSLSSDSFGGAMNVADLAVSVLGYITAHVVAYDTSKCVYSVSKGDIVFEKVRFASPAIRNQSRHTCDAAALV